jgi:hypothetical protein
LTACSTTARATQAGPSAARSCSTCRWACCRPAGDTPADAWAQLVRALPPGSALAGPERQGTRGAKAISAAACARLRPAQRRRQALLLQESSAPTPGPLLRPALEEGVWGPGGWLGGWVAGWLGGLTAAGGWAGARVIAGRPCAQAADIVINWAGGLHHAKKAEVGG